MLVDVAWPIDAQQVWRFTFEGGGEKSRGLALIKDCEDFAAGPCPRFNAPRTGGVHSQHSPPGRAVYAKNAEWSGVRATFDGLQAVRVERCNVLCNGQWRYPGRRILFAQRLSLIDSRFDAAPVVQPAWAKR